jgi:hypothetical protein
MYINSVVLNFNSHRSLLMASLAKASLTSPGVNSMSLVNSNLISIGYDGSADA